MKHILVYGDSQTWGTNPETKVRYDWPDRWPGALGEFLGEGWEVIEQGLRGRTTTAENPHTPGRNGRTMLPMLLESHAPLDVVILMLGTNDISRIIGRSAVDAAWGCAALIEIVRRSRCGPGGTSPKCILVAPPPIRQSHGRMVLLYDGREAESNRLSEAYEMVAKRFGADFFDAGDVVSASEADGVHPDRHANRKLGQHLAARVLRLCQPQATSPSPSGTGSLPVIPRPAPPQLPAVPNEPAPATNRQDPLP